MLDSGASDSVIPRTSPFVTKNTVRDGEKKGVVYRSATGGFTTNEGEVVLNAQTKEGGKAALTYQVAQVSQPLTSVAKVCDAGNYVVFSRKGGVVMSEDKKQKTMIERRRDLYVLDVIAEAQDFQRQGERP